MKKLIDFLKTYKDSIIWVGGFLISYAFILFILFGFNSFSLSDWTRLAHSQLRGFPGFAFGVLIAAALPLLIATTCIIIRTGKPLIKLPARTKKKETKKAEEKKPEPVIEPDAEKPFPDDLPSELKVAFLRARQRLTLFPKPAFEMKPADSTIKDTPTDIPPTESESGLPLPVDFDFSVPDTSDPADAAPVFKEINFDNSDNNIDSPSEKSALVEYLEKKNYVISFNEEGNIITANDMVIITHADSDFWIADIEDWFAAGKQKKSPIADILEIADRKNLKPVIYLAEKNIMDLDTRITEWESLGVRVITNLSDID